MATRYTVANPAGEDVYTPRESARDQERARREDLMMRQALARELEAERIRAMNEQERMRQTGETQRTQMREGGATTRQQSALGSQERMYGQDIGLRQSAQDLQRYGMEQEYGLRGRELDQRASQSDMDYALRAARQASENEMMQAQIDRMNAITPAERAEAEARAAQAMAQAQAINRRAGLSERIFGAVEPMFENMALGGGGGDQREEGWLSRKLERMGAGGGEEGPREPGARQAQQQAYNPLQRQLMASMLSEVTGAPIDPSMLETEQQSQQRELQAMEQAVRPQVQQALTQSLSDTVQAARTGTLANAAESIATSVQDLINAGVPPQVVALQLQAAKVGMPDDIAEYMDQLITSLGAGMSAPGQTYSYQGTSPDWDMADLAKIAGYASGAGTFGLGTLGTGLADYLGLFGSGTRSTRPVLVAE